MMDLLWIDDLTFDGLETQSAADELFQDCYHVIEQDPDSNLDDPGRGLGLANALSNPLSSTLTQRAEQELQNDTRVNSATATVVSVDDNDPVNTQAFLAVRIVANDAVLTQLDLMVPIGTSKNPAA